MHRRHDLPTLSTELSVENWEQPINELMLTGKSSLERLVEGAANQARFTIGQIKLCIDAHVGTGGFHRLMLAFADRPDFLDAMADQIVADPKLDLMVPHLSSVLYAMHARNPGAFRTRALLALESGVVEVIHAAANNLRVFTNATEEDIAVIRAFGGFPNPVAKHGAIRAITYMGKFTDLQQSLKTAVLSIHTEGDKAVAAELAEVFGTYGVPLTSLTREDASAIALEFLLVRDWEFDQGAIPRFLNHFVSLFPDETYELLIKRIELSRQATQNNQSGFRSFGLIHENISFGSIPSDKRLQIGRDCIARLLTTESKDDYAELFWDIVGYDDAALNLILESSRNIDDQGVRSLSTLIGKAAPSLAFSNREFVKSLIRQFTGEHRQRIVDAVAYQSRHRGGGFFMGDPEQHMAEEARRFRQEAEAFADERGFEDLAKALRRLT